eukprot:jgi/Botrbrau1/2687/Bobra.0203s0030.1
MASRFEAPDGQKHAWERASLLLPGPLTCQSDVSRACGMVWGALGSLWGPPAPPIIPPRGPGTPSPPTSSHILDLHTRKAVSEALATLPQVVRAHKAAIANLLNSARAQILRGAFPATEAQAEDMAERFRAECGNIVAGYVQQQMDQQ